MSVHVPLREINVTFNDWERKRQDGVDSDNKEDQVNQAPHLSWKQVDVVLEIISSLPLISALNDHLSQTRCHLIQIRKKAV